MKFKLLQNGINERYGGLIQFYGHFAFKSHHEVLSFEDLLLSITYLHASGRGRVATPHHDIPALLEEEHLRVEGGRDEGQSRAAAVVHGEEREVVAAVVALKEREVGADAVEELGPDLGRRMGSDIRDCDRI